MTATAHPLDNVIWSALTTQHAALAEGDAVARRYPAAMAPFGAVDEMSAAALTRLVPADGHVVLFTTDAVEVPAGVQVTLRGPVDQMVCVCSSLVAAGTAVDLEPLGDADVAAMQRLVAITNPGPWKARTHELGRFLGVRAGGELVAMTGERMHLDGFTEVSAVCVHPEHRGKGHAAELVQAVSRRIVERGETPMLHVLSTNAPAIALYRKLGFVTRRSLHLTVLQRAGQPAAKVH